MKQIFRFQAGILFLGCVVVTSCVRPSSLVVEYSAAPTGGTAPLLVQFTDESSVTGGTSISGWTWDFGDGGTSSEENPIHVYLSAGSYTVTLTVTDGTQSLSKTSEDFIVVDDVAAGGIPSAPFVVSSIRQPTNERSVNLAGSTVANATVEVIHEETLITGVANHNGNFDINFPLAVNRINRINRIFVSAIDTRGQRSAATPIVVTQDETPPSIFVDFPAHGSQVTNESILVAGRVGDMLSGFMGLEVSVNGSAAEVDVGVGNNGTFGFSALPLDEGVNIISASATDSVGNTVTTEITVERVALTGPQMTVVSGNDQRGQVSGQLPDPIMVQLVHADGMPFVNKTVTFRVTRSNGVLSSSTNVDADDGLTYQARTNESGIAQAYWTLGVDAGCGNNRVEATSEGVSGTTYFCASAEPGPAAQINIGSGNNQRSEAGGPARESLNARVSDGCNGIASVEVRFSVSQGNGSLGSSGAQTVSVFTDITGHAEVPFTLGDRQGLNVVQADFDRNLTLPTTFTSFGVARDGQSETSFTGIVLDNGSQPVEGVHVSLEVNGQASSETVTTSDGRYLLADIPAGLGRIHFDGATASAINGRPIAAGTFPLWHSILRLWRMRKTLFRRRCCSRHWTHGTSSSMTALRMSSSPWPGSKACA